MQKRIFLLSMLALLLLSALTISACSQTTLAARNPSAAALSGQIVTPPPPQSGESVIGSTDGIFLMGIVIVLIIGVPLLLRKRK